MTYAGLVTTGLRRKLLQTTFTLLTVLVAFILFGLLAATRQAFTANSSLAGQHRLITMSRVSLVKSLPLADLSRIQAVPGVEAVSWENWFGGYYQDPKQTVFSFAVDADSYLNLYSEYVIPDAQVDTWRADRAGAIVGASLARKFGWEVGDTIPLQSNVWRDAHGNNTWTLTIDGIYLDPNGSDNLLFFHYKYWNERTAFRNDTTGIYVLRIADDANPAAVADRVDALFVNSPHQTRTTSENAFIQNFAAQYGNIGALVTAIVGAVFFGMLLVTANTMARAVRERTSALATMRALGFRRGVIATLVIAESLALTVVGGLTGLGIAWLVAAAVGARFATYVAGFYVSSVAAVVGVGCMIVLGLLSAALPCWQVLRMNTVNALRKT